MKIKHIIIMVFFLSLTLNINSPAQDRYWTIVTSLPETLWHHRVVKVENGAAEFNRGIAGYGRIKIPADSIKILSAPAGKANPLGGTIVGGLIGGVLGATLGGVIGASSHEDKGFMDFGGIEAGITGALIGGSLGVGIGCGIGYSIATNIEVEERYNLTGKALEEKIKILEEISRKK